MRLLLSLIISSPLIFAQPGGRPHTHSIRIERHQAVPMRDGVTLYCDAYLPNPPGKYPTIIVRTPYGVQRDGAHEALVKFAQNGYATLMMDTRGRYESEGKWDPFRSEAQDGYDTVEWAAAQPWSNGKVGLQGGSYLGHVQWAAASQQPPHLVAIFPAVASTNIYSNWINYGGAFRLSFNYGWGVVRMPHRIMLPQYWHTEAYVPEELKYENLLWHLPLATGDTRSAGNAVAHYRDWLAHPSYDAYWKAISDEERMDKIQVPAHTFGGWFDIFLQGTLDGYTMLRAKGATEAARKHTRMIVGPWGHGASRKFGDVDFGEHAFIAQFEEELRFFDFHLKGVANGLDKEPPVKIFYMGTNQWKQHADWPVPGTKYQEMFLSAESSANGLAKAGRLSWTKPAEASESTYRYDPMSPVPTIGGNNCCGTPTAAGPKDQRPLEQRQDVLVYQSEMLPDALAIAGPLTFKLHAATDGADTDWVVKLIDVYPNGFSMPVAEGILRARYRNGYEKVELLTPKQSYEFKIPMAGTANVFQKGHRIRVLITSSNFPQFDRNPNTGEAFGASARVRVATQTVYHSPARPSAIVLPVVPLP